MEIIETQEIKMNPGPGNARVVFLKEGVVEISYYLPLSGKLWRAPLSVDLFAARLYVPGPVAFLKHTFYKCLNIPSAEQKPENQQAIERANSFIDEHGQEIIDKARELGLMAEKRRLKGLPAMIDEESERLKAKNKTTLDE